MTTLFQVYMDTYLDAFEKSTDLNEQTFYLELIIEGIETKLEHEKLSDEDYELLKKIHNEYCMHYERLFNL